MKGYVAKRGKKYYAVVESTWHGYRRKIEHHILPTLGKTPIKRLKVDHLDSLYDAKLRPTASDVKALAPKTVLETHLIIRGSLNDTVKRGMLNRNVATAGPHPTNTAPLEKRRRPRIQSRRRTHQSRESPRQHLARPK